MSKARTRLLRVLALACMAGSAWIALRVTPPTPVPGFAFGDPDIFRIEAGVAVLIALSAALAIVWRTLVEGQLPVEISGSGVRYPDIAGPTADSIGKLEVQQLRLAYAFQVLAEHVAGNPREAYADASSLFKLSASTASDSEAVAIDLDQNRRKLLEAAGTPEQYVPLAGTIHAGSTVGGTVSPVPRPEPADRVPPQVIQPPAAPEESPEEPG